jgi:phage host-nuclease inhibitor protein Gam
LKQARAFGIGLILATQNPADLDYKGLSNAGTWFIGRLQSDQDKDRVATGLQSLASVSSELNLRDVRNMISDVEPRVFLMHNIHDQGGPVFVHTRWAMSYLRGPLTRQQVQLLMADQQAYARAAAGAGFVPGTPAYAAQVSISMHPSPGMPLVNPKMPQSGAPTPPLTLPEMPPTLPEIPTHSASAWQQPVDTPPPQGGGSAFQVTAPNQTQATTRSGNLPGGYSSNPPPISSSVSQYYLPTDISSQQAITDWEQRTNFTAQSFGGVQLAYRPLLLAQATIRYQDVKRRIYTSRVQAYQVPELERAGLVHWDQYVAQAIDPRRVSGVPLEQGLFGDLPPGLTDQKRLSTLQRELLDMLYATAELRVPYNSTLDLYGNPDAEFSLFRASAQQIAREKRDAEVDAVTNKYQTAMDKLDDRMRQKTRRLDAERQELAERRKEELYTTGEAILSLLNRRTTYTLSRMSRASLYRKQSKSDIKEFQSELEELEQEAQVLQEEFQSVVREVNDRWAKVAAQVEEFVVKPYKKDISIDIFGIGWLPFWYANINGQPLMLPAAGRLS